MISRVSEEFLILGCMDLLALTLLLSLIFYKGLEARKRLVNFGLSLSFLAVSAALVIRGLGISGFPVTNRYDSIVFLVWSLIAASLFLKWRFGLEKFQAVIMLIGVGLCGYASKLPPRLMSWDHVYPYAKDFWGLIHTASMMMSYAFFVIATVTAISYIFVYFAKREFVNTNKIKNELEIYDETTYRSITLGFPLLTVGTISGLIWAQQIWGSVWNWDPKETLTIALWLVYVWYFFLRMQTSNKLKTSLLVVLAMFVIYLTYFGIHHLNLPTSHSYGAV